MNKYTLITARLGKAFAPRRPRGCTRFLLKNWYLGGGFCFNEMYAAAEGAW